MREKRGKERVFSPNGRLNLQRESEISSCMEMGEERRAAKVPFRISWDSGLRTSQKNWKMKNELMQCGRYQGYLREV